MSETERKKFTRVSWPEMAVAAALTAILVGVVVLQWGGGGRAASAEDGGSSVERKRARDDSQSNVAFGRPAETEAGDPWKSTSLDGVLDYDPFRLPSAFLAEEQQELAAQSQRAEVDVGESERAALLAAARAAREAALARLSEQGFHAFLSGGGKDNVAVIGSRAVRVGDVVDGFRVVSVEPSGVVIEPVESP
jgi:hypothetical protein